jgi:hypothetical protein
MEEEAVGCDALRAARAVLGVQAAAGYRPPHQAHPPGQGPPPRLQGQAGRSPRVGGFLLQFLPLVTWSKVMP